jgi:hypothetical protein
MTTATLTPAMAIRTNVLDSFRTWTVALVFLTSFVSTFQPAPCDIFFVLAFLFSLQGGLRLSIVLMPLLLLLMIYNLSGLVSYLMIPFDRLDSHIYLIGLAYTSFSGFFFAAYIANDPARRFRQIMRSYWIAATIGAVLGLLVYFEIIPTNVFLPGYNSRVVGAYKDPNVYSTWLVLPFVTMLQGFIMGTLRLRPLSVISFLLIFTALFLAFSRGAWIDTLLGCILMIGLTYVLSPSKQARVRIVLAGFGGIIFLAVVMTVLLSIPATRDVFLDRFTLVKSYDAGETGRFGNQLNAIPLLLQRPFGFGPYQFEELFGIAPHNTFLNSFASAGWAGGLSYILFVVSTVIVGVRSLFIRSPLQPYAIVVFSCYLPMALQGIQIDTEHWRHLYWMVGMIWGFYAASLRYTHVPVTIYEFYKGWNLKVTPGPQGI